MFITALVYIFIRRFRFSSKVSIATILTLNAQEDIGVPLTNISIIFKKASSKKFPERRAYESVNKKSVS